MSERLQRMAVLTHTSLHLYKRVWMIVVCRMRGTGTKIFISRLYKTTRRSFKLSDNHDLLNDNDMCSFSGHEAEDMCFNCGDHTLRSCYAPDTTEEVTDKSVWCK